MFEFRKSHVYFFFFKNTSCKIRFHRLGKTKYNSLELENELRKIRLCEPKMSLEGPKCEWKRKSDT